MARNEAQILNAVTSVNGAPSGASDGIAVSDLGLKVGTATFFLASTAGSGTMNVTIRMWGYSGRLSAWAPLGVGADADKGKLNEGASIGETGTNSITHAEPLYSLSHFDRVYAQVTAINGTDTAVSAWLITDE